MHIRIWNTTELKAEKLLDHLCEKGLLVDSWDGKIRRFVMPPPMIGFFEFALMRTRGDIDQKYLSELFHQYLNVEEDFIKDLFIGMETPMMRTFVQEPVLMTEKCVGCGKCAKICPIQVITPVNSTHRYVVEAIEKGKQQNLIFDNQAFASHRAMAALFGTILKLPPIKQALASKQMKSVYLDRLLASNKKKS